MKSVEIGIAVIEYSKSGKVNRAFFTPTMETEAPQDLKDALSGPLTQAELKGKADILFANWINAVNHIELADRELYEVQGKVVKCEEYNGGQVKTCAIKYSLVKIVQNVGM